MADFVRVPIDLPFVMCFAYALPDGEFWYARVAPNVAVPHECLTSMRAKLKNLQGEPLRVVDGDRGGGAEARRPNNTLKFALGRDGALIPTFGIDVRPAFVWPTTDGGWSEILFDDGLTLVHGEADRAAVPPRINPVPVAVINWDRLGEWRVSQGLDD